MRNRRVILSGVMTCSTLPELTLRAFRFVVLAAGVGATIVACGSDPPRNPNEPPRPTAKSPRMPMSETAQRVRREVGGTPRDCGEVEQGLDNTKCDMENVFQCLKRALRDCTPAHGAHMFAGSEGDPIRIDYFVKPDHGLCWIVVVQDESHDPVGKKGVTELECRESRWKPHPSIEKCEVLETSSCKKLSFVGR